MGYEPAFETPFTILTASSITGTFMGLEDGAWIVSADGFHYFEIHYTATTVTLTLVLVI